MMFGEIVEPSTRALIDDDDYPEYTPPVFEWTGDKRILETVKSLIFIESKRIQDIFHKFILHDIKPVCSLNNNIVVYKKNEHFIISYTELYDAKDQLTTGEIVQALEPYIISAEVIYTFTSSSLYSYQGDLDREQVECLIKCVPSKRYNGFKCDRLESPNFIVGLGANIMSYCIIRKYKCLSFILYYKNTDIDSMSSRPILELAEKLSLSPTQNYLKTSVPAHNLYM